MKVARSYLGRHVEIRWRDPGECRVSANLRDYSELPKGRGCLATWTERGVLTDYTDGVLRIEHSIAEPAPLLEHQSREHVFTFVPEELVETIRALIYEGGERHDDGTKDT